MTQLNSIVTAALLLFQEGEKAAEKAAEAIAETATDTTSSLPDLGETITNYQIILVVAIIAFVSAGLLAAGAYYIDRNANERDV